MHKQENQLALTRTEMRTLRRNNFEFIFPSTGEAYSFQRKESMRVRKIGINSFAKLISAEKTGQEIIEKNYNFEELIYSLK